MANEHLRHSLDSVASLRLLHPVDSGDVLRDKLIDLLGAYALKVMEAQRLKKPSINDLTDKCADKIIKMIMDDNEKRSL